jgi:hypothetical protein
MVNARIESGRCVLIPQMCDRASLPVFHMSGELFKMMIGIDVHTCFIATPTQTDLLGGRVQVIFNTSRVDWAPHLRQAAAIGGVSESVQTA